ncbi:MAG TPA: biotin/lipoyl-containing protein, partial [Luteolibacter sp.]
GYQFTGRTIPVWNRWRKTADFQQPWLLRFFDQLRFHPVEADELLRLREDVPLGRHKLEIEESVFRFADYEAFLEEHAGEIAAFRATQQAAFQEERRRWEEAGLSMDAPVEENAACDEVVIPDGCHTLDSPVSGSVWKIHAEAGARVSSGGPVMILEAMKMEIALETDVEIEIVEILAVEGSSVKAGQALAIAKPVTS